VDDADSPREANSTMACGRMFITLMMALLLCSCASEPPASAKVPPFENVAFVTPEDIPNLAQLESESEVVEKHMYAGAAVGTMGGAAIGAAACGPVFYGPCVLIASWYGLVAGTSGGIVLGLYNYSGLSDTDSAYFEEVLLRIEAKRSTNRKLTSDLERQFPSNLIALPQDADIQVVVRVSRINFVKVDKELISTQVYGTMVIAWAQASGEQSYRELFTTTAPAKDIDDLLADDGRLLERAIDECLFQLAEQMSSRLIQLKRERTGVAASLAVR